MRIVSLNQVFVCALLMCLHVHAKVWVTCKGCCTLMIIEATGGTQDCVVLCVCVLL
jgi:hypothetical protein